MTQQNLVELLKTDPTLAKSSIKKMLNEGTVRVRFKKVNGDERDMVGTTSAALLPPPTEIPVPPSVLRKDNDDVCKLFDVNKQEWRSFRYDNLIEIGEQNGTD